MPLTEAGRLAAILSRDPSTRLCAAVNGWDYPFSREATVLADIFDLWTSKDAKEYPRPWNQPKSTAIGAGTSLTPAEYHKRWKELSEKAEARRLASLAKG